MMHRNGEIYRPPEVMTMQLLRNDPVAKAFISERFPVFPADNAIDRSMMLWCSKCGWKYVSQFGRDKTRSDRQGRTVHQRLCRECDAKRKREAYQPKARWKR